MGKGVSHQSWICVVKPFFLPTSIRGFIEVEFLRRRPSEARLVQSGARTGPSTAAPQQLGDVPSFGPVPPGSAESPERLPVPITTTFMMICNIILPEQAGLKLAESRSVRKANGSTRRDSGTERGCAGFRLGIACGTTAVFFEITGFAGQTRS